MCKLNDSEKLNLVPLKQYAKENRKSEFEILTICSENGITLYKDCPDCDPAGTSPIKVNPQELDEVLSMYQRKELIQWDSQEKAFIFQSIVTPEQIQVNDPFSNSLMAFLNKVHVAAYFGENTVPYYVIQDSDNTPKLITRAEAKSKLRKEFKRNSLIPCKKCLNEVFNVLDSCAIYIDSEHPLAS